MAALPPINAALAEQIRKCQEEIADLQDNLLNERLNKSGEAILSQYADSIPPIITHSLKPRKLLRGHFGKVYALSWCYADGKDDLFVSASQDGKLIVWDTFTANKKILIPLRSAWVMTVAYSPYGDSVACGGLDNVCSIYKVDNYSYNKMTNNLGDEKMKDPVPSYELSKHEGYISSCRFIGQDKIITGSGDGLSILWDIIKNQPITTFRGHESDVMSITANDRGDIFYSASCDGTARVWDVRTGTCIQTHEGHESDINSISLFPDGYSFATGSDDSTCKLFDTRSWNEINTYKDEKLICNVTAVQFSASGRLLFAGYDDCSVQIWDTLRGTAINPMLQSHDNRVSCLGLNKSGSALATGSWDNTLKCWA